MIENNEEKIEVIKNYIKDDLEQLTVDELGIVYRFIRKNLISKAFIKAKKDEKYMRL